MYRKWVVVVSAALLAVSSQAGLFSGNAFVSEAPTSQMGFVSGALTITNLTNGFDVSGILTITVGASFQEGMLIAWFVERPLNPTYGTGTMATTTNLVGYSAPPPGGTFAPTFGFSYSEYTNFPGVSASSLSLPLTNGAATWSVSASSAPFAYTSGGVNYLRQVFAINAVQETGPGGTWTVDVPLTTTADVVPEPSGALVALPALGVVLTAVRRRRG